MRKVVGTILLAAILVATGSWLYANALWPFVGSAVPDPSLHNHPAFTYSQAGLKMDMNVRTKPDAGGTLVSLAFNITDLSTSLPVTSLENSHGKPMHVVGVRDGDLNQFFHIHPERKGDEWVVEYVIREPGNYSVWPGIAMGNSVITEKMPSFTVGQPRDLVAAPDFFRTKSPAGNFQLVLDAPSQIKAGKNYLWAFKPQDGAGREIALGSYLEASLHVNVVSMDTSKYQHLHTSYGMINPKEPGSLELAVKFDQPGEYKVFVEFVTLDAPNEVRLVEYWVEVLP